MFGGFVCGFVCGFGRIKGDVGLFWGRFGVVGSNVTSYKQVGEETLPKKEAPFLQMTQCSIKLSFSAFKKSNDGLTI